MAYTVKDYKTKKALKDDLARIKRYDELVAQGAAKPLTVGAVMLATEFPNGRPADIDVYAPGGMGLIPQNGAVYLEGPHYPKPHTWYAEGTMENGKLVRVK